MFQVTTWIKECPVALLTLKGVQDHNAASVIKTVKEEMERLQQHGDLRDWHMWKHLKQELPKAYRDEEVFQKQKSWIKLLKKKDKNTKFFHAYTVHRCKKNCIVRLVVERETVCRTGVEILTEVGRFYNQLFT